MQTLRRDTKMKITKRQLRRIIREEKTKLLDETLQGLPMAGMPGGRSADPVVDVLVDGLLDQAISLDAEAAEMIALDLAKKLDRAGLVKR